MTQDIFRSGTVEDLRTERAQRAVKAFRAMQPGLSGYARAITGRRDVTVELAKGAPQTDGKKIYFKPPIALGDLTPHDRAVCERREDTTGHQMCPACRVREEVLILIYHEIAHIVFGTFAEPSSKDKAKAIERAIEESGGKYAARIRQMWATIPDYKKNDYLNLSSLISPFLPVLINAIEDARVDEGMFKARRGTRVMLDAYTKSVFRNGIELDDGTYGKWSERPLNSQVIIGIFVLACKYDYKGWFHPDVEAALADDKLCELVARVDTLRSAEGSYNLAFPVLARLRELGFCKGPEEPDDTPEEEEEGGNEGDEAGSEGASEDEVDSDAPLEGSDSDEEADQEDDGEGADRGDGEDSEVPDVDSHDDRGVDQADDDDATDEEASDSDEDSESDGEPRDDAPDDGAGESESDSCGEAEDAGPEGEAGAGEDDDESAGEAGDDGEGSGETSAGAEESGDSEPDDSAGRSDFDEEESTDDTVADGSGDASSSGQDSATTTDEDSGEQSPADEAESGELTDGEGSGDWEDREGEADGAEGGPDNQVREAASADTSEDAEAVDTGADEGEGGTRTESPEYGNADDALRDMQVFSQHDVINGHPELLDEAGDDKAVDRAIVQGQYFEKPSANVSGVREHKYGDTTDLAAEAWQAMYADDEEYEKRLLQRLGISVDVDVAESILGPALLEMRRTFSDNARAAYERHLRSGRINQRVLGKRAWAGDDRLFQKKRLPGRKSYAVLLGIDISGSTVGLNLALAKRAAVAQAELCHRAGIDFAIYAHTANGVGGWGSGELWLDVYEIKSFDQPWSDQTKKALSSINADAENLDGHSIEYYRRMIERHPATDKIILYYSDGKMPAANHDEELEILQREIATCRAKRITLMGVGIRTDSPRRHGLDTVQVDDDSDIVSVVRHLENALLHSR